MCACRHLHKSQVRSCVAKALSSILVPNQSCGTFARESTGACRGCCAEHQPVLVDRANRSSERCVPRPCPRFLTSLGLLDILYWGGISDSAEPLNTVEILAGKRRRCACHWTMLVVRSLTALVAITGRFDDLQPSCWVKQSTVEQPQTYN